MDESGPAFGLSITRLLATLLVAFLCEGQAVPALGQSLPEDGTLEHAQPPEPLLAPDDAARRVAALLASAELARSKGDVRTQIAELRRAHGVSEGKDSKVVNLLASALRVIGELEEPRRLREAIIATGIRPIDRFSHLTVLTVYAAGIADIKTANRWLEAAESTARQLKGGDDTAAHLGWAKASLLLAQGKYREAEVECRNAVAALRRHLDGLGNRVSPQSLYFRNLLENQLASALLSQGKIAESEWIYRDTLERSVKETGKASVQSAKFSAAVANAQLRQGRFEASLAHASASLKALERHDLRESASPIAFALLQVGWAQAMAGRFEASIDAFEARAKSWSGSGSPGSVVWGYAMIRAGRAEAALPMLRAHYEASRRTSPGSYTTHERAAMYGYAQLRANRIAEAQPLFESAIPVLLRVRQARRTADRADILQETISNWIIEGYLELLSRAASAGDENATGEMFRLADIARGSSVNRALALASTRAKISDPVLAQLAREEQDLGNHSAALARIVEDLLARTESQQPKTVIANIRRDIDAATRERELRRSEIAKRFPQYAQLAQPQPVTMSAIQTLLVEGEVLLSIYTSYDRSYVWAIRKFGPVSFSSVSLGADELTAIVKELRHALDVGDVDISSFPAFDTRTAYALYERLLKPIESSWEGAKSLIVVPHGALGQLPFALLPTTPRRSEQSQSFDNYRDTRWLIRAIAVFQLPSVSALAALRDGMTRTGANATAFLGVGDPIFGEENPSGAAALRGRQRLRNLSMRSGGDQARPASRADFSRLPPLPDTAVELNEIAALLKSGGSEVLLGRQASETNVRNRDLSRYRILMFATHGLVPGDLDGLTQPALALSNPDLTGENGGDGLLALDEILGLRLNAEWVVLSACNTASSDGEGSEAVSGLGRAFFYAGARSLLVSNWPVETVSARLITTDLFRRQSEKPELSRSEALRQTMLNLIDREEVKDGTGRVLYTYAHPMFWAPFSLVGDGGR